MIASVRGEVVDIGLDHAVIEAAGVGYLVYATAPTLAGLRRGEQARLLTAMHVREDSMTLYGFADAQSRELFALLQTVSGVGAKLALAVLGGFEPAALRAAIGGGDTAALTRVSGVGKRLAERLVVDLRDKVGAVAPAAGASPAAGGARAQVVEALVGLGFSAAVAEAAAEAAFAAAPDADVAAALRSALASLARRG